MKLFGLRDEQGRDVELTISDEGHPHHHVLKVDVKTVTAKESEFKAGDWVVLNIPKEEGDPIRRIISIDNHPKYPLNFDGNINDGGAWDIGGTRYATSQEIENCLRKICDEKYLWNKVTCLVDFLEYTCVQFDGYDKNIDVIWYKNEQNTSICVYEKGVFAEIVKLPKKKPIPTTKEELIADYEMYKNDDNYTYFSDFIHDKYED